MRGPQLGTQGLPPPSSAPLGLQTLEPDNQLQMGASNPGRDKTGSDFGLTGGCQYQGPAQQWVQETLPRGTDEFVNFLCAISIPIR